MKTPKIFLEISAVDYDSLPYSGEHESMQDMTNKKKWLRLGKKLLNDIAKEIGAIAKVSANPSGDIDRGYVSGFLSKGDKHIYISLNDGMNDILYRTASSDKDYTGGSNNNTSLDESGVITLIEWAKENLN